MRPSDRTIRDELRREAASVPIPEDMWQNISRQMGRNSSRKTLRQHLTSLGEQWRPAVVLAVAAGFFWFALIPSLPSTESVPGNTTQTSIVIPSGKVEPAATPVRPHQKENDPVTPDRVSPGTESIGGYSRNIPQ